MRALPRLAWRNLWRNGRRTGIAVVAVVLGVVLLMFMDGLFAGSDQAIFGNAVRLYGGNIQVHAPGYRARASRLPLLPLADGDAVLAAVRSRREVKSASKRIVTAGMASSGAGSHPAVITGVEPSQEQADSLIAQNMAEGRFVLDEDGDAVVIGRALAEELEASVGDRIQVLARGVGDRPRQRALTVVGVYDLGVPEVERRLLLVNLATIQEMVRLPGQATEVNVTLDKLGGERRVIADLTTALPGYEIDSWETLRPELRETLDAKMAYTSYFGIVVLFIASIGILNLLMMAVFERTREMGVMAALGLKGREIMALFVLEGAFIGVLGGVIGCVVGAIIVLAVGRVGIDLSYASGMGDLSVLLGERLRPTVVVPKMLGRAAIAALMATVAAVLPAWRAGRRQPAEVLHHI